MSKYCYIDFEFNHTKEPILNLVCASLEIDGSIENYWLYHDDTGKKLLADRLDTLAVDHIFVAFNAIAEARSIINLPIKRNIREYRFIDLFLEYRCLTNHNNELQWGKQLIDGNVINTLKPKRPWEDDGYTESGYIGVQISHSLSQACYKFLNYIIDTERKDKVRDLIISDTNIEANKNEIIEYCESDVYKLLADLLFNMREKYKEYIDKENYAKLEKEMLLRGKYAVDTALMEHWGYPVNVNAMKNFTMSVSGILSDTQKEINNLFPTIRPFKFDKKKCVYTWDQSATRLWIKDNHSEDELKRWPITDSGILIKRNDVNSFNLIQKSSGKFYSLSLDSFKTIYNYRHEFPTDKLGAQMVRYLNLKQSLNGFSPTSKNTIWDYVGSDGRVRPYFNIYKAQSSRSQPSATSFLFLKAAWMRVLCEPIKGKAICGIDFGSQEYLISALLSEDEKMLDAYKSGDVYLAFAKEVGAVPQDGTKKQYKAERDLYKGVTLAMSYNMTKYGLSVELTQKLNRVVSEEEAQGYINRFYETYNKLKAWQAKIQSRYTKDKFIKLPCGWYMWGDNENHRSVGNVPVQGTAASIMRLAVEYALDRGLKVIFTLHDAIYIEYDSGDFGAIDTLNGAMRDAFIYYFDNKEDASMIRLDANTWSPDYTDEYKVTKKGVNVKIQNKYIDERSINEYAKFKNYFDDNMIDLI